MDTRRLGQLEVTVVGLGCNNFGMRCDEEQTGAVVAAALDEGVNFFDTADSYGAGRSEEMLGTFLASRRDEVVIATKFGSPMGGEGRQGASARWVARAAEDSLRRLRTDRIDLYQLHRPDPEVPIEETLGALGELVRQGKVREIGCSNFSAKQIEEAAQVSAEQGLPRFVSVQNHYNLLHREPEAEVIQEAERHGLGFLPFFPLAHGVLTGKYQRDAPPPPGTRLSSMPEERRERVMGDVDWDVVDRLTAFAASRDHRLNELAIAWLAAQPTVASVIAGATRPEQVRANVVAGRWTLSVDEEASVRDVLDGAPA